MIQYNIIILSGLCYNGIIMATDSSAEKPTVISSEQTIDRHIKEEVQKKLLQNEKKKDPPSDLPLKDSDIVAD